MPGMDAGAGDAVNAPMDATTPLHARDAADVAAAIRDAAALGVPLRIRGAGQWLDAGRPVTASASTLDVSALRGIVEYNPGDLTLTARAGTTLAEIDAAARANGQWLPLDPAGAATATLGATLATASCGPLAAALGHPRDLALGLEFVDGRGVVVRGGGRVVKNVAGFDLVRLAVGAWGTLGVITEATVRLRARPEAECTLALAMPRDAGARAVLLRTLRDAPLAAIAMELVDGALLAAIANELVDGALLATLRGQATDAVLLRLAGNAASVAAQRRHVESLGAAEELPATVWERLAAADPPGACSLRCSHRPSRLAELWDATANACAPVAGALRHASVERGIARLVFPAGASDAAAPVVRALAARWSVVGERLPPAAWDALPAPASDHLSTGVRAAFDPHHILNPGLHSPTA